MCVCLLISGNVAKQEGEIWLIWSNQMLCLDLMPVMFGFIYHIFYYASNRKTFLKYYSSDKEKKINDSSIQYEGGSHICQKRFHL